MRGGPETLEAVIEHAGPNEATTSHAKRMRPIRRLLGRAGCRSGAVALETAIVIVPFLLVTLMTVEIVLIEFFQAIFTKCVQDVARQIRTGTAATNTTDLVSAICNDAGQYTTVPLPNCSTNTAVIVNVISSSGMPSFSPGISNHALVGSSIQANGSTSGSPPFPGACNLVVFQAFYRWQILIPGNRILLNSGFTVPSYLFASAAAFQDEPPSNGGNCSGLYN